MIITESLPLDNTQCLTHMITGNHNINTENNKGETNGKSSYSHIMGPN